MKIIIADDQSRRYQRLVESLATIGIPRRDITIVNCAKDASDHLSQTSYDLLILDILLPYWSEDDPASTNSLNLLFELHESDEFNKPGHILGLTADMSVIGEASDFFKERTWQIIEYSDATDEWINTIMNCTKYLLGISATPEHPSSVDLAIVCALESPELEEVLKLPWNWEDSRPLDDQVFVHDGFFQVDDQKITVSATYTPRMGMVSTALRSSSIIYHLRPRLIAMCGICAGVRGKVNLGDVVLADPAWDFQSGKWNIENESSKFDIAPHQLHPSAHVRAHIEQIKADKASLREIKEKFSDAPNHDLKISLGPLASGSAVLSDGRIIETIRSQHRNLLGVEMEAYGLYAAANAAARPQPAAFVLKSVCDFADPGKADNYQRYAAFTSANVLRILMEKFGPRLLD